MKTTDAPARRAKSSQSKGAKPPAKTQFAPHLPPPSETQVQAAIVSALRAIGCFVEVNGVSDKNRGRNARAGLGPGSPDLLVIVPPTNYAFFVEVKAPGKVRRPNQIEWERKHAVPWGVVVVEADNVGAVLEVALKARRKAR